jgi:uncharacterized protein
MTTIKRRTSLALLGAAGLALGVGLGSAPAAADEVVFATGPVGGSWYPIGQALGEIWRADLGITTHVELGGGEANLRGVQMRAYDIGLAQSFASYNASQGDEPFEAPYDNVKGVASLYPNIQQTVVFADSDIHSIADLAGTVIAPGPQGFGGETLARAILEIEGMSYDDMARVEHVGYSDAITLMKDRHIDVFWPNTLIPAPSIAEAAALGPGVRVVPLEDRVVEALEGSNPGLFRLTIPAGTYRGQDEDVQTVASATTIIARADLDEELVYELTKSLVENRQRLMDVSSALAAFTIEGATVGLGIDLHPGAERYYREIGAIE